MLARFKTPAAIFVAGWLSVSFNFAHALGLGEITLNSTINEPLDASIELIDIGNLDESQIIAEMGSLQEFARTGVNRQAFVDVIDFEVTVFDSRSGELRLTSTESVVEPVLNFLINLRWPNGRLLREYTVLMDLPASNQTNDEPQAVIQPLPEISSISQTENADDLEPQAQNAVQEMPQTSSNSNAMDDLVDRDADGDADENARETIVVQSGDNLWNIAAEARGESNVSVQQTMLAIQRLNPEAFINGNINLLRSGSVLRLPDSDEIDSLNFEQAVNQVSSQNQQAAINEPLAVSPDNREQISDESEDELTILTAEIEENEALSGELSERIAALENQLAVSEESRDRARVENEELVERFSELESQIQILQDIIAIEDQRIAQLQAELAEQAEETEQALAVAEAALETAENTQAQAEAAQISGPGVNAPQPASSPGLLGTISDFFQNTIVLIVSLLVLIALVLWYLMWRRQAELEELEELAVADGDAAALVGEPDIDEEDQSFVDKIMAFFRGTDSDDLDEEATEEIKDKPAEKSDEPEEADTDSESSDESDEHHDEDTEDDLEEDSEEDSETDESDDQDDDTDEEEDDGEEIDIIFDDESDDEDEDIEEDIEEDKSSDEDDENEDEEKEKAELKENQPDDEEIEIDVTDETESSEAEDSDSDELDIVFEDEEEPAEAEVQEDDDTTLEFSIDDDESEDAKTLEKAANESDADDDVEALEFSLDDTENEELTPAESETESTDDLDTLEFTLDDTEEESEKTDDSETEEPEESEDTEKEKSQASEEDLDLGEIDIDDSVFSDEEEADFSNSASDRDESSTKLDLAVAYEAMGDVEGAKEILEEVIAEGNEAQVAEAKKLMDQWDDA